jgi:hypothetical protein
VIVVNDNKIYFKITKQEDFQCSYHKNKVNVWDNGYAN